MSKFKIFFKSILFPVIVGAAVGFFISDSIDYTTLIQPPLAPPSILFPIVWTILYILMGISYGILKSKELIDSKINFVYLFQLTINALWSIFFFSLKWRLFSGVWIILLLFSIVLMIYTFYQKDKTSAYLQIPYLLWTLFATYLNWSIYFLNK